MSCAWRDFDGKVVAVGPCGHVGVELHLLTDPTLDSTSSAVPSWTRLAPEGVAHAVGGRRLRVLRASSNPNRALTLTAP